VVEALPGRQEFGLLVPTEIAATSSEYRRTYPVLSSETVPKAGVYPRFARCFRGFWNRLSMCSNAFRLRCRGIVIDWPGVVDGGIEWGPNRVGVGAASDLLAPYLPSNGENRPEDRGRQCPLRSDTPRANRHSALRDPVTSPEGCCWKFWCLNPGLRNQCLDRVARSL
jgi:hypothetical protein